MAHRKMVKWQPFAALTEQSQYIGDLMNEINKKPRPILSEEQIEEINEKIIDAYNSQEEIIINYFHKGYFYDVTCTINKIDRMNHLLIVNYKGKEKRLIFKNIIDLKIK
ncbi:YolD-like family protein [Haloplasma contractile]|uniref:PXO2-70 protein n=1 Tax=Haloplasma contractile SSD-17B TaxID=1033810 RepID=U2EB73_9MOLU|nr:YolD-like family protein [Haloplasma contractile]ERJ12353.1 PXO2-70 protein [Haloplasma contractile SSD-17B]